MFDTTVGDKTVRAFAFQRCIGGYRGAMDNGQFAGGHGRAHAQCLDSLQDRALRCVRRGQHLVNAWLPIAEQHKIRKGSAGIDTEPV